MILVGGIEELLNKRGGLGRRAMRRGRGWPAKDIPHSILNIDQMPDRPWEGRATCASVPGPPDAVS